MTAPDTRGTAVGSDTSAPGAATRIDLAAAAELEKKYDSEVRFPPLTGFTARLRPQLQSYASDYDHLSRKGEWADGDTPEGAA